MYTGHHHVIRLAEHTASASIEETSTSSSPQKKRGGRFSSVPCATQAPSGTWSVRMRRRGHDVYISGCKTKSEAEKLARQRLAELERAGTPKGQGPERTTLGMALQAFALKCLPSLKGARQEAGRINTYLRLAGLPTVCVTPLPDDDPAHQLYFNVTLTPPSSTRSIPKSLITHRTAMLTQSADAQRIRAVLAHRTVASIERSDLQKLVDAMKKEGKSASTIALERAVLRRFFNYAERFWNWRLPHNPATGLKMPRVDNQVGRALSHDEEVRLEAAMKSSRNPLVLPVTTLLRETAMRTSEPLAYARWQDVDWQRCVLTLTDSKNGRREVPLSPKALQALRDIGPGQPQDPIVTISYETLKAAWNNACQRAGVANLRLYDLRHTGATRLMLETGNIGLVKALTGHKTMAMLERYIRIGATDVVAHFQSRETQALASRPAAPASEAPSSPAPASSAGVGALSIEQLQTLLMQSVQAGLTQFGSAPNALGSSPSAPAGAAHTASPWAGTPNNNASTA